MEKRKMEEKLIWVILILIFFIFPPMSKSEDAEVKQSLVEFMAKLSSGIPPPPPNETNWGWNMSSDPCIDHWSGVECDKQKQHVKKILLNGFNFNGTLDAGSVCTAQSLMVLSLNGNSISGNLPVEIGNCKSLSHFYVSGNRFSGKIPDSISQLSNLRRLDVSNNELSGELPRGLSQIPEMLSFIAQNNELSGSIADLNFLTLLEFNVSNNNFSGPVPDVHGKFPASSFFGNPDLCGAPLPKVCQPVAPADVPPSEPAATAPKHSSKDRFLIYSGYIILFLVVFLLIAIKIMKTTKPVAENSVEKRSKTPNGSSEISGTSSESKTTVNQSRARSEYSITEIDGGQKNSSSLVVLSSPVAKSVTFENLLQAPAELLGRGKHGSTYKVTLADGMTLVVKRIKDWGISREEFKRRMRRIDQVKHPRVLSPVAFYCSKQEKLLVYQYQHNGSLFKLLHGSQTRKVFDWGRRLRTAAATAEALAFMYQTFHEDGIAHGNLKSVNVLFDDNMEPCISEYGLMMVENQDQSFLSQSDSLKNKEPSGSRVYSTFKVDVYSFGVILLELLTGKLVQNNGFDLAKWVHSVVREEWTVEVFDKALIAEGASQEMMVNLLQVALKCINPSPNGRPSIHQVSDMINTIKEEEDRSISLEA